MPEGDAQASDDTSTLPEGHPLAGALGAAAGTEAEYDETPAPTETPTDTAGLLKALADARAEADKHKALSKKHEAKWRTVQPAIAEAERLRQAAMSEQEKAVEAARLEARQEAIRELGSVLVSAEIRSTAAGRVDPRVLDAVLARLDTTAFLDDDGRVDAEAVAAFVESIAPPPPPKGESQDNRWPDLGQGQPVGATTPLNSSGLERALMQAVNRA